MSQTTMEVTMSSTYESNYYVHMSSTYESNYYE